MVMRSVRAKYKPGAFEARLMHRRFGHLGDATPPSQQQLSREMNVSPRKVRDTISSILHAIPPPPEGAPLEIIFEDRSLIAISKPAGVPVTPTHRLRRGSMINRLVAHLGPRAPVPAPVHRLDLNTSGVLLFAKSSAAAASLMPQFEQRQVSKTYAAICAGVPEAARTTVDVAICRVAGVAHCERRPCAAGEAGAQHARTALRVVAARRRVPQNAPATVPGEEGDAAADLRCLKVVELRQMCRDRGLKVGGLKAELVERLRDSDRLPALSTGSSGVGDGAVERRACLLLAAPEHGRTHQVRIHCSSAGAPMYGDELYGVVEDGVIARHALHALTLSFAHPATKERVELLAPLPADMVNAIAQLQLEPEADTEVHERDAGGAGWDHLRRITATE